MLVAIFWQMWYNTAGKESLLTEKKPLVMEIRLGDVVRLRKPHPCGSDLWQVVRVGADIGLRCQGCQHRVLLPRSATERRIKEFVSRGDSAAKMTLI